MAPTKKLSNPFSTGGGGTHFEAHVQASFVALMLTGGYAPCLPCWPIAEVNLQGKIDGFDTDDLIVVVEDISKNEQWKLLGQVKHSISITQGSTLFGEVMQAAWNDFQNPKVFRRQKDIIALITGPLSATDTHNVQWLLNQARHTKNNDEFFRNIQQANFSPPKSAEKLEVIQYHLKAANSGNKVSRDELYDFLNHFHILSYDLGNEFGVVLSLLHSHISQFQQQYPQWAWSRIVDIVQTWNKDAGTITPEKLPDDLLNAFKQKVLAKIPEEFKSEKEKPKTDWTNHPDTNYLALAVLLGSWQDKRQGDRGAIEQMFGVSYEGWLKKAREILHFPDSPLSINNGTWKVVNRVELWNLLGSRILDQNLDTFRSLAVTVLKEPDPTFELRTSERYAASLHGKSLKYSQTLRKGIAEGLAILGSHVESCTNCSQGKTEATCLLVIRELLTDSDWVLWGSLNQLLPTLAEASPSEFLNSVEKVMRLTPCPFDELFSQEGNGFTGSNYLTGLLWALEGLAWDEQYLVRACVALGELASRDPGGQWANRPNNSLATILLPWMPQTLASVEKRKVAVQTIFNELPDIAWKLIIQLLPDQHRTSIGSHKPIWRKTIPMDWKEGVTKQEYWQQTSFYSELAVAAAGQDTVRLSELIDHIDNLPIPAFDQLLQALTSQPILELPEEQRLLLWNHLSKFIIRHRRHSDAKWALPDDLITSIEKVAKQLAPSNPIYFYQHLFTDRDFDLYMEKGDFEEQRKKLSIRREKAISEIYQANGIKGIIQFNESVSSTSQVGYALGSIADPIINQALLPHFLNSMDSKLKAFVGGFIWRRHHLIGWDWCDEIDKSNWTPKEIGQFLAYLPFSKEAWDRASQWLQANESEYWTHTGANAFQAEGDLSFAIEKLIEYGRPHSAITCLFSMLHSKESIDSNQSVRALIEAIHSKEPSYAKDEYQIVELIKFLQKEPSIDKDDLFKVEWAYIPLLVSQSDTSPKLLESRLANDPNFFCEVIQLIYRSEKDDQGSREPTKELTAIATNSWQLLHEWKIPPGTQKEGTFSEERFTEWLQTVKEICRESGHLEVALIRIGEVLIHTPPDPNGLWIRHAVAAALNDREADKMRSGFRTGTYNSRGAHWVDPSGQAEKKLAEHFRNKAEEVENVGFQRFAATLRGLANEYEREAEQVIEDQRLRKEK